MSDMSNPQGIIAGTYVKAWDHHVMIDDDTEADHEDTQEDETAATKKAATAS